jgi:hypothetical protein
VWRKVLVGKTNFAGIQLVFGMGVPQAVKQQKVENGIVDPRRENK